MGLDFIRKAAPAFHKGLDQKRIELATPTLFTQQPGAAPRTYAAHVRGGEAPPTTSVPCSSPTRPSPSPSAPGS